MPTVQRLEQPSNTRETSHHGPSSNRQRIARASIRIIRSAWCAASSATCRKTQWLDWIAKTGFDGWEEATWELDLKRCGDDAGAKAYAEERVGKAKKRGLEILSLAAHLQGQALGDEPSAKTIQFLGGESVEAYAKWRAAGNNPPRTDPFYVPADVAEIARRQATEALVNTVRLAHFIGKLRRSHRAGLGLRRLAGPLLEPLVLVSAACPARSAGMRFPTCSRSAWNCWSSGSRRCFRPA